MSEVKTRPSGPRGRGSGRGSRGGFSNRGGRGGHRQTNGSKIEITGTPTYEEEGDIGELKSKYAAKIGPIKEMFPDWTEQDIAFALDETDGDLEGTVERISEGNISQWGEVKKKTKDRNQSKPKEAIQTSAESSTLATRGGRGRGSLEGPRGARGRGSDRGRGSGRGGRGSLAVNGLRTNKSETLPAVDSPSEAPNTEIAAGARDSPTAQTDGTSLESSWENVTAGAAQAAAPQAAAPSSKPDGTRSWASMLAKPKPAPAPSNASRTALTQDALEEPSIGSTLNPTESELQGLSPPLTVNPTSEIPNTPPISDIGSSDAPAHITPSKDELTKTNVEQVLDTSGPTASLTAASTVASTLDPLRPSSQRADSRPPMGGFATSAYKATGMPGRSASFQRKILEQQEAVVMPGKHAVDRAAVQFGSMGLNGTPEDVDVDSDREDAETRAQPPQHSPIAPRAALPPAPQQQGFGSQPQMGDSLLTPRQAPGLPPVNQPPKAQTSNDALPGEQSTQSNYHYNQFNDRYGTHTAQQGISGPAQKPHEPFGQQTQPHQYDGYPSAASQAQTQAQAQGQQSSQSQQGGYSGASDMSSFYTSENQRNAYPSNYYGNYGQQPPQESGAPQQRGNSAFGTSAAQQPSQYPTSQGQQQTQNRYGQSGEAQTSGNSTPNPSISGQQQPNQQQQMHQQQQAQGQGQGGGQHGGYPYGYPYGGYYSGYMNQVSNHPYGRERPMYDDVRRLDDQYLTQNPQYGYGGSQGGYGGGHFGGAGGKQGMYGQPHQGYGMSPQPSYDQHSASPANAGAFGSQLPASGRDSAATGSLGGYGRSGSAQPSENPQQYPASGAGSHGNMPDVFGRSQSGYQGQSQGLGANMGQQAGNDDPLRGYGDSKVAVGPSPALGQPGGRPGSAANSQSQGGAGQSHAQGGYGGYPGHMSHQMHGQQSSQYGAGPGGVGGHQSGGQTHQAGGYGGYGGGYGGNYYGSSNRGGWGANYGH